MLVTSLILTSSNLGDTVSDICYSDINVSDIPVLFTNSFVSSLLVPLFIMTHVVVTSLLVILSIVTSLLVTFSIVTSLLVSSDIYYVDIC